MNSDVTAGVHSSDILAGICIACMEMLCNFDRILYATCIMDSNKKHSERKKVYSTVVAMRS